MFVFDTMLSCLRGKDKALQATTQSQKAKNSILWGRIIALVTNHY